MKLIDRHEFANNKVFETYYLDAEDAARHNLPVCDVIGFCYDDERKGTQLFAMRPDEALIQARMLVDAVYRATSGYEVKLQFESVNLDNLYPKYNCPTCGDWFHMPWKFCKCQSTKTITTREVFGDGPT